MRVPSDYPYILWDYRCLHGPNDLIVDLEYLSREDALVEMLCELNRVGTELEICKRLYAARNESPEIAR